jgi:hypothetical protein
MKTASLWRVLDAQLLSPEPDVDVMTVTVSGGGKNYTVAISGHKGMLSTEFVPALQAATAALILAAGGDPSVVGAQERDSDNDTFNTGNQRAN